MGKKIGTMLILSLCLVCCFSLISFAQDEVDWEKGIITATGVGVPSSKAVSLSQARAMAYRAAKADAYRNLAEIIDGVQVDSETTVKNLALENDVINLKIKSFIKGARVVSEKMDRDGTWHVTMKLNLYGGTDSLSKTVYDNIAVPKKPLPEVTIDTVRTEVSTVKTSTVTLTETVSGQYTGLVVDVTGLQLERCMSPKIIDETGREIYGTMYVDGEYLSEYGILSYAYTPNMLAKVANGTSRAGNKPLTVKAVGVANHGYNMIISKADGDLILAANKTNGFLQKCAVIAKKG